MGFIEKVGKYTIIIFLAVFIFTALNLFLILFSVVKLQTSDQWIDHSYEATIELEKTMFSLQASALAQHDYLITGDTSYLSYLNTLNKDIYTHIKQFQSLISNNPLEQNNIKTQNNINTLDTLISSDMNILKQEIDSKSTNPTNLQALHTEEKKRFDDTRNAVNLIENQDYLLLRNKRSTSGSDYSIVFTTAITGSVLNLLLIILAYYLITLELARRHTIEKSKDEFISMASHELKTPITSLKLFMQVINKRLDRGDIPTSKIYIAKIDTQINKLTKLVANLLDISRIQTGKMKIEKELFNLDALIDETVETIENTTNKHQIKATGNVTRMVEGDRYRIGQVVTNLLTNAIKYSPEGGIVVIETKKNGSNAVVSIKDHGIGIDKKHHLKIFDRLYQVTDPEEKTYPGLGIGLFVSKQIIELHKGRIWMDSEKGKGSTFYFSLPFVNKQ